MCQGQQCTWHMPFPRKGVTQLHVRPHSTESSRSQPGFGKVSAATSLCLHSPALVPSFFSPTHPCFAITSCASGESLSCHIPTSCNALHWLHVVLCSKDTSPHTKQGVCGDRLQRGLSCAEGTHPSEGGDTATHWAVSWDTCWGNTLCPQAQALPAPCQMPLFRWLPTPVYLVGRTWRTLLNITPLRAHPTHWACLILAPPCVWSCRPNLATAASAMPLPCLSPSFAAPQIQPCKGGKFYFTFLKKGSKHPENLKLLLHNPLPPSLLRNPITWTNTFWGFKIDDRIHVILFVPSS